MLKQLGSVTISRKESALNFLLSPSSIESEMRRPSRLEASTIVFLTEIKLQRASFHSGSQHDFPNLFYELMFV